MRTRTVTVAWLVLALGFSTPGCKSGNDSEAAADSGNSHAGSGAGSGGDGGSPMDMDAATDGDAAGGATEHFDGSTGPGGEPVDLPAGSREVDGIVNLVDSDAASQLDGFFTASMPVRVDQRQGLTEAANAFLTHYSEEYDFLFFFTDHPVASSVAARFEAVNAPAVPGGTGDIEVRAGGYRSAGRLKGVIGVQYRAGIFPPIAHELLHYWGNYLDTGFGFSDGHGVSFGPHWGMSSINGQLGGFDAATLKCEVPGDAVPPACTAEASGRYRYVVGTFAPNTNTFRGVKYAPLELYLMGLLPAAEVPNEFQLMKDAEVDPASDNGGDTLVVEAAGIETVAFADIVARHGKVAPLAKTDRAFRAAFVVVSAEPADDSVLKEIASWAAVFGDRENVPGFDSFKTTASDLATLDTQIGARRTQGESVPAVRETLTCDVVKQDCPTAELACHESEHDYCSVSDGVTRGGACTNAYSCAPGLDCIAPSSAPDAYVCEPYCDSLSDTAESACAKLCPGSYLEVFDAKGKHAAAICLPS